MKRAVAAIFLIVFIQFLQAQVTITVPAGTLHTTGLSHAEWRKPLGTYFGYERSAMIYSHTEIGQYGLINSAAFYCDSVNVPGNAPIAVYMKEVASYSFAIGTTVANEESGAQLVYSGILPDSAFKKGNWINIPFTNPFLHATPNAVEVIIETNATGTGNEGSLAKGFYHYTTSVYAFQYWSADNTPPANAGLRSYKRPNIQFDLTPVSGCAGVPMGGTTLASVDSTCDMVSLSLNGSTAATGIIYQWEDSLAAGSWVSIAGANTSGLVTSIVANTWFRCKLKCGSDSSYSSVKQVIKQNYLTCYCNSNLGGNCNSTAIDSVAIETTSLVNGPTGCSSNNYTQYPAVNGTCAQLLPGQNYNLHTMFNGSNLIASVWIDYNQSGDFDSSEWKQICTSCVIDSDYVTVLSVPSGAVNGLTLMRIRSRAVGNSNDYADACTNFGSGETEDYFIGINYDVSVASGGTTTPFLLFPNPAATSFSVIGVKPQEPFEIHIYSTEGILVQKYSEALNNDGVFIDVSLLPAGVYFVKIDQQGVLGVKKLVINR